MGKDLIQKSLKDSLFTGIIALALFGPIVGLRTVAKNEVLVVEPKWLVVLLIVAFCAVGRFFINLYTFSISGLPKKTVGKNIKTITKVVKAAISLYSIEMYPDQKVSINPINNPPSIAPGIDPIPPNTAAVNALIPAKKPI